MKRQKLKKGGKKLNQKIIIGIGCVLAVASILFLYSGFFQSQIKNIFFSYYPEFRLIDQKISKYYEYYHLGYSSFKHTVYLNSGTKTTDRLTVTLSSTKEIPPRAEYGKAGRLVCNILKDQKKHYDIVTIRFVKQYGILGIYPFYYSEGYNGSCQSWFDKNND